MKGLPKVLGIILIVIVALVLMRNVLVKVAVKVGAKAAIGMDADIKKLNIGLTNGKIDIQEFKLHNPKGFVDPLMVDLPRVLVDVDLAKALKGEILVEDFILDLKEILIVVNENGEKNIDALTAMGGDKQKEEKPKEPKKDGKAPKVGIENLHLKIGKVVFKDYSKGGEPRVKEYVINLDEKHQNIMSLTAVSSLIMFKVMTKTALGSMLNVDLGSLEGALGDSLGMATEALGDASEKLKGATKGLTDAADGLKDKIKLPFGN